MIPQSVPSVEKTPRGESVPSPHGLVASVKNAFAFAGWLLSGFGLLAAVRRRRNRSNADEIVVYTVHPSFYLWAVILLGFVASACVSHWHGSAVAWGWAYVFVLLYTIATLLFDVSTLKALLWGGIFCLLWIASKYLEDLKHITVLSGIGHYLAHLRPALDPGMASVMSWVLLVPWIGSLFHSFSRGRKAFSPNSIEERYLGEGREISDRSGLKFRTRYRDWFETVLGLGACDLEAVDSNHHVVKRWENVLFLTFVWKRLDEILHQRSAVVDNTPANPVEVETVK
jgi:MYXO-CTERM domain-containing protein